MSDVSEWSRRKFMAGIGLASGAAALGCDANPGTNAPGPHAAGSSQTVTQTTKVFVNGVVLPVDEAFSQHEAFAISGNQIVAMGTQADVMAACGPDCETIDLEGKVVLPGFIEPHMHFGLMAGLGDWPDIGPFVRASSAEALDALREIAAGVPVRDWVTARQFDPSLQTGLDALTTKELDAISNDKPIFVLNASGHLAYVNSRALELAGYGKDTPDPAGGVIYRDAKGRPNGVLSQIAWLPVVLGSEQLTRALAGPGFVDGGLRVCEEASRLGITTLCDQATGGVGGVSDVQAYRKMVESGKMKARIRASLYGPNVDAWKDEPFAFGDGDAFVKIVGWKLISDGSNQGFTGRQRDPYYGKKGPDSLGLHYIEPKRLAEIVLERARKGWPLVIHGNGDAAIDSILDAVDAARQSGVDVHALRIRIEHCSILHDEQIARIRDLGISPSFLINHVHYWGQTMRDNVFGPEKVMLLDRCKSVQDAGIKWTMHSDAPVSPLGPLQLIRTAVARDLWREPETVLNPDERVSVEQAIRAVTSTAAWQCHSEREIGTLEVGKLADFVVLDRDPRQVEPTEIAKITIRETWMDGARVFRA